MILQFLYKFRDIKYIIKGLFLKCGLYGKKVEIGRGLKVTSQPRLTLLKKYSLKIGNEVTIGQNVDLRVYDTSTLIIEDNCKIDDGVRIIAANGSTVHLKQNTKIGFYSVINGGGSISIGPDSSTYGFVYIQSSSHTQNPENGFIKNEYIHAKIEIGKSVLIGPHSVILPGSKILDNTTLEPHTVSKNV